jgi:hypothetical protein
MRRRAGKRSATRLQTPGATDGGPGRPPHFVINRVGLGSAKALMEAKGGRARTPSHLALLPAGVSVKFFTLQCLSFVYSMNKLETFGRSG